MTKLETRHFEFGTKAETLAQLSQYLHLARLCDQLIVLLDEWKSDKSAVLDSILDKFGNYSLAIRSSSPFEDNNYSSAAGVFESLMNVAPARTPLTNAIESVFKSYKGGKALQVLIQPMVENVALSGVVMTRDLDTGAPYYVINYDDFSGRTDTVTGGAISKTVVVHRANPDALHSPRMRKLISAIQEIEEVTHSSGLDIEFCITSNIDVYILQVRPVAVQRKWQIVADLTIDLKIKQIRQSLGSLMNPQPNIAGSTTIFGEMPDWNPAEMVGNTPRPLALSLYKTLITDQVWSDARTQMGYRQVSQPLLIDFAGRPYIDVRLSLNSFLPSNLRSATAEQLIDFQLATLAENKDLHDKIEFDVALTCIDFSIEERLNQINRSGLSKKDTQNFKRKLHQVTVDAINTGREGLSAIRKRADVFLTEQLWNHRKEQPLEAWRRLLNNIRLHGTLPFSILARHAFIAVTLLRSAVQTGIIDYRDFELFLLSIKTIAKDLVRDMECVATGILNPDEFMVVYGHLRPGTYDILSWRYDEKPHLYLGGGARDMRDNDHDNQAFALQSSKHSALESNLILHQLADDVDDFLTYAKIAIQGREKAKFAFTRGISNALKLLTEWGKEIGFSRDDLSYLTCKDIENYGNDSSALRDAVARGREAYLLTRAIHLPHLITEPDDIDVITSRVDLPTFVTTKTVTSHGIHLSRNEICALEGKIVMIESADPGFDWIFSHNISGLVTKFGGANSHMTIRCAEFELPAAIGCGGKLFDQLRNSKVIELNCGARTLRGH